MMSLPSSTPPWVVVTHRPWQNAGLFTRSSWLTRRSFDLVTPMMSEKTSRSTSIPFASRSAFIRVASMGPWSFAIESFGTERSVRY
jgi:hypothetical protein